MTLHIDILAKEGKFREIVFIIAVDVDRVINFRLNAENDCA